jgi:uncharacterized protein (DUF885 family)
MKATMPLRPAAALAFAATLAAALLPAVAAEAAAPQGGKALAAFFEREFRRDLEEAPEYATILGIPGMDDRVTDFGPAAVTRRRERTARSLAALKAFDPAKLTAQERISRGMMMDELAQGLAMDRLYGDLPFGSGWSDGPFPVTPMWGPQQSLPGLARSTAFRTVADYENYLSRLGKVPTALEQIVGRLRAGLASGWVLPREAMQAVPGQFDPLAGDDITATPLWAPFAKFPEAVPPADRERLAAAGRRVLAGQVHPAFAAMKRFLEQEYIPRGATSLAASDLPGGRAYYELLVRRHTTTSLTADEIHALGLAEVERIGREMEQTAAKAGFAGDLPGYIRHLKSDKRHYFTRGEDALAYYRDIAKRADAQLPRLFAELPRLPYGVRAMDASLGDNADSYTSGALDGSRAGFFEANVTSLATRPKYDFEATFLHEAVPGHHLQSARAQELKGLPTFRRTAFYAAYVEGWALYAERLGYEMGFYREPENHYGALSAEMLRACRLVVDTGLHAKGWTREQVIRYLVDHAGLQEAFAAAEADRYVVWAGQAPSYKVGELRIRALRARAEKALGERFDVRRFHNALLDDGPLPLTILESRIDQWIARERGRKPQEKPA